MRLSIRRPVTFETKAQREAKRLEDLKRNCSQIAAEMRMGEIGHKPERRYVEARESLEALSR